MSTTITGDAELRRKLAKLKDISQIYPALFEAAIHVKGKVSQYPPSTSANQPGGPGSQWYQRGWGTKWKRKDGSEGGSQTSEDLGPSWTAKGEQGKRVIIGNDASYGPYVQGPSKQARALKAIGWKTTDTVVKEEEVYVLNQIKKRVDIILRGG